MILVSFTNNELVYNELSNINTYTIMQDNYTFSKKIADNKNGFTYSLKTKLVPDCSIIAGELSISYENNLNKEMGNYIIPTNEFCYIPDNFVRVVNNSIFLMVPKSNAIEIQKVSLGKQNKSNMDKISKNALNTQETYNALSEYNELELFAVYPETSLTREEVLDRANRMASFTWTLTADNIDFNTVSSTNRSKVTIPYYIRQIISSGQLNNGGTVTLTGIPYCWGGFMSQYSTSSGLYFADAIRSSYTAGNVINAGSGYIGGTAGIDCSGFVSAAYGETSKMGTSALLTYGSSVAKTDYLRTMDYFVKDGHTLLFYQWLNQSTGSMLIIEANSTDATGKVIVRNVNISEYISSKSPYQMRTPW